MTYSQWCDSEIERCIANQHEGAPLSERVGALMGEMDMRLAKQLHEEDEYAQFLESKKITAPPGGFTVDPDALNPRLFDWQRTVVSWALRKGKCALMAGCGMGKSFQSLEWAFHVWRRTDKPVLVLAPLAVAEQTVSEGQKFGIHVHLCRSQADVRNGINITNYDMLQHFDSTQFSGVVVDESSCLRAYDGATRQAITDAFAQTPYRLCCSATPSPNDYMELGTHAEFLGICTRAEMLATFFVHDSGDTSKWRLKRHAEKDFWRWLCSWAVMMEKPSDIGDFDDAAYQLPELIWQEHVVPLDTQISGMLFTPDRLTLDERRAVRVGSLDRRIAKCAEIAASEPNEGFLFWCDLNIESDALSKAIPRAVEVKGSDSRAYKLAASKWFSNDKCLCNEPMFSAKLTAWELTAGNQNINLIEREKSQATLNMLPALPLTKKAGHQKKTSNTCGSITPQTRQTGPSGTPKNKQPTMPLEGLTMLPIKNLEKKHGQSLKNGRLTIQKSDTPKDYASMGSLLPTIDPFLNRKEENALSVESKAQEIVLVDSMLTTAIDTDMLEDCSVVAAISDSVNFPTIPLSSNEQQCICGNESGQRSLISKASIFGYGMNWTSCNHMVFVGLSDSFEWLYQAVRRCWRFGQTKPVYVHVVISDGDGPVLDNIKRKERDFEAMKKGMIEHMRTEIIREMGGTVRETLDYKTDTKRGGNWTMHLGDSIEVLKTVNDDTIGYSVYSLPFASLYTYSASDRDLGNSRDYDQFFKHYAFIAQEMLRVMKCGRLVSVHCMNLPTSKEKHGYIGIQDFRGDVIRAMQAAGFIYHSEVVIYKDPVTAMQRTKALGLLYKQLRKDSCMSRQGVPDYLCTFRKPGDNPDRVTKTHESFPVDLWQQYASPVWMDINQSDTLQRESAREEADERHICPLQLEVIERAIRLWSNSGDVVLDPFGGIGSTGFQAIKMDRRFLGIELKESYFRQACLNLAAAETAGKDQHTLFDMSVPDEVEA